MSYTEPSPKKTNKRKLKEMAVDEAAFGTPSPQGKKRAKQVSVDTAVAQAAVKKGR